MQLDRRCKDVNTTQTVGTSAVALTGIDVEAQGITRLEFQNHHLTAYLYLSTDGTTATTGRGQKIAPGGAYVREADNLPVGPFSIISDTAGVTLSITKSVGVD